MPAALIVFTPTIRNLEQRIAGLQSEALVMANEILIIRDQVIRDQTESPPIRIMVVVPSVPACPCLSNLQSVSRVVMNSRLGHEFLLAGEGGGRLAKRCLDARPSASCAIRRRWFVSLQWKCPAWHEQGPGRDWAQCDPGACGRRP
jgi:hypothetical protein